MSIPPYPDEASNQYYSVDWIKERFREVDGNTGTTSSSAGLEIPRDFAPTVPYHTDEAFQSRRVPPLPVMGNPQTDRLLQILQLDHVLTVPYDPDLTPTVLSALLQGKPLGSNTNPIEDANEIDIDSEESEGDDNGMPATVRDDNEIDIESDEDDNDDANDNTTTGDHHATTIDTNEIDIDIDDDDDAESDEDTSVNAVTKKARLEE